MTVTVDLTAEQETQLTSAAQESGTTRDIYLQGLMQQTLRAATPTRPKPDREAMLALLDDLADTDKYGTAQEQRETLESLKDVIRPLA